jgi:hypothetical protein
VKWRRLFLLILVLSTAACTGWPTTSAADPSRSAVVPTTASSTAPVPPFSAAIPDGSVRLSTLSGLARSRAVTVIESLTVRGRGPKTGYSRAAFGDAWSDDATGVLWAGNGCSTRDDVLARDLDGAARRDACVVVSGSFTDPYTGLKVTFSKSTAEDEPVDHVVPLSFGWQMGASRWPATERLQFANDPLNLVLTTRSPNTAKRDSDPASWLPPNKAIRCAYVTRFALVSLKYQLPVTASDKQVMLAQCSDR